MNRARGAAQAGDLRDLPPSPWRPFDRLRTSPARHRLSAHSVVGSCHALAPLHRVDPARFGATREDIRLALERANIESRPLWKPMHLQPVFAGCDVVGGAVAVGA